MSAITLRYWAGARAAAGCERETVEAASIAAALAAASERRADPRFDRVVAVCSVLVGGVVVRDLTRPQSTDIEVELLPPFAGGSGAC